MKHLMPELKNVAKIFIFTAIVLSLILSPIAYTAAKSDKTLERIDFVHYVDNAKATGQAKGKADFCYKLLGVEWSQPVNYVINPANPQAMPEYQVVSSISTSAEAWDAMTSTEIANDAYLIDYNAAPQFQDFRNVIGFADYGDSGVIGVTTVWYNPSTRQIIESDMLLNSRIVWGDATADPTVMDLQNIATHEFGHVFGLADIYSASCTGVTMYGYAAYGETNKRSLEAADIKGLRRIYGA